MTTEERMKLIGALEVYARWLRYDLDRPSPEKVEWSRAELMELLRECEDEIPLMARHA